MTFPPLHEGKGTKKNLNGKEKGRGSPPQLAQSCQTFIFMKMPVFLFLSCARLPLSSLVVSRVDACVMMRSAPTTSG